jgi:hypothetical protein
MLHILSFSLFFSFRSFLFRLDVAKDHAPKKTRRSTSKHNMVRRCALSKLNTPRPALIYADLRSKAQIEIYLFKLA